MDLPNIGQDGLPGPMNLANVLRLRDLMARVAKNPSRFDMAYYYGELHDEADGMDGLERHSLMAAIEYYGESVLHPDPAHCGAPACMAGWCQLKFASTDHERAMAAFEFAKGFCGLSHSEARRWFSGWWSEKPLVEITAAEALAFLDNQLAEAALGWGELVL